MRAILFRNGIEEKRGNYPRKNGLPIIGLENGLEWKLIVEEAIPQYDPRLYNLVTSEDNSEDPHPTYPHLKQYKITYSTTLKSKSQIKQAVRDLEDDANSVIFGSNAKDKYILLGLGILIRKSNGITISLEEEEILDKILSKANNVWLNDVEMKDKINRIDNNQNPNLDDGWTNAEE